MTTKAEDTLNRIRDVLKDETLTEIDSLYAAADIAFEDEDVTPENRGTIFQHEITGRTEWDYSRRMNASRNQDGSVEIILSSWTGHNDATLKSYLLPVNEAERFGRALCGAEDDTFDGLANRAKEVSR